MHSIQPHVSVLCKSFEPHKRTISWKHQETGQEKDKVKLAVLNKKEKEKEKQRAWEMHLPLQLIQSGC